MPTLNEIKAKIPVNWELLGNPVNWIIVFLMIAVAGAALALIVSSRNAIEEDE